MPILYVSLSQHVSVGHGRGSLTGHKAVKIQNITGEEVSLTANHAVVLATGSEATMPDYPWHRRSPAMDPREATASAKIEEHLVILGGAVVRCEMATAYGSYGKKVILISSSSALIPRFEPEASKRVELALEAREFEASLSTETIDVETVVLVANGRRPRIQNVGLEIFGINPLILEVNDSLCLLRASGGWLYAIGDANARSPLIHVGAYQARAAARTVIAYARGTMERTIEPWSIYSATADHNANPQVVVTDHNEASVGLTFVVATRRGINAREVAVPSEFPGTWVHAEFTYDGWGQWVINLDQKILLGATFVGHEAADLLHASAVAIMGKVPIERLWHAVPSFPTMSELLSFLHDFTLVDIQQAL